MLYQLRVAAVAAVVCSGCAFAQDSVFAVATPESQGVSSSAVAELGEVAAGYVEKGYAVGSELLVIKNRRVIFHESYGLADREGGRAWATGTGAGTVSNIRSMTKTMTGAAAQILIDRGQLSLDDRVSKFLEGFDTEGSREITVRQVLTHRSGLPLSILKAIDEFPDLLSQANAVGAAGPEFEPESKFWYSDMGTDVVGAIVEVISGETLEVFVDREIIEPLGMTDTFYGIDGDDPRFARIGSLYVGASNAWTRFWEPGDGPLYPFAWGSQTVYSTPLDYAKFLAMWMDEGVASNGGDRVLSTAAVERTLTPASPMSMLGSDERFPTDYRGLDVYYGQMVVLYCPENEGGQAVAGDAVIISHSGSDGTIAWAWPELDLMVLYFTQSRGGATALRLESAVDRLLVHPGEAASEAAVPAEYGPYVGVYIANFGTFENEEFTVLFKDGGLALDIPSQMVFALLEPDDEGKRAFALAPEQVQVEFALGDDGLAGVLRLHQAGAVFEVPRKGSALALEMGKEIVIEQGVLDAVSGKYRDPESDGLVEVFLADDGVLSARDPGGNVFQLRPKRGEEMTWVVKQNPRVSLRFDAGEDGAIVSMIRHVGDNVLVMPRQE